MNTSFHLTLAVPTTIYYIAENHCNVKLKGTEIQQLQFCLRGTLTGILKNENVKIFLFFRKFSVKNNNSAGKNISCGCWSR